MVIQILMTFGRMLILGIFFLLVGASNINKGLNRQKDGMGMPQIDI
jgi:hypothetical protein